MSLRHIEHAAILGGIFVALFAFGSIAASAKSIRNIPGITLLLPHLAHSANACLLNEQMAQQDVHFVGCGGFF